LELGQHVDFALGKQIRFHGGFQYANIYTTNTNVATSASTASAISVETDLINSTNTMKYSGFGPRIGADLSYMWSNGFAVYANGASALLVGSRNTNYSSLAVTNIVSGLPGLPISSTGSNSNTTIVPEIEAKAGATYTYSMAQGNVSIDAGWMWANYFNAQASSEDLMNFAVHGPFAGFKWVG
jgi:hypothetical protein